jgi:hypothetical protein
MSTPTDPVRNALAELLGAAKECSRLGAQTGKQWGKLTVACLHAESALLAAQPAAPARLEDFKHWLDDKRDANVSEVFHDIVAQFAELAAAPAQPAEREAFEKWALPVLGDNPTWRESGDCEKQCQVAKIVDDELRAERDALVEALHHVRVEREGLSVLLSDALSALEYHQEQTRPIHSTKTAIAAIRAAIKGAS